MKRIMVFLFVSVATLLLFAAPRSVSAAVSVTGKITLPDGTTGVADAWVSFHDNSWTVYQGTRTSSTGTFTFNDLPTCACTLDVYANHSDYADPDPRTVNVVSGESIDLGAHALVQHNVIGKLVTPSGTGISSVSVAFQSSDYTVYRWYTTKSTGEFRFRVPTAGSYLLRVYNDATVNNVKYYAPADATISVTDAAQVLDLGNVAMKNPNVTGTLTFPDGTTPVTNGYLNAHDSNWSVYRSTSTASDGTFGFYLAPGQYTYEVWASSDDYNNPDPASLTVTDGQTTALGTVKLVGPNMFFKVTKTDGTTPVSGASVSVHNPTWSLNRWRSTKADGTAGITIRTAGTYTVEVWANDPLESNPDTFSFSYTSGDVYYDGTNGSSVIRLQVPAMRGTVRKPDGTAAQYASLTLTGGNGYTSRWASTDSSGNFMMPSVATGSYTLRIQPPWDSTGLIGPDDMTVSLTKGTTHTDYLTTPITLVPALKTITGSIVRPNGTAVTNAYVYAWKQDGSGWAQTQADSSGRFTFLVGSGKWSISIYPVWTSTPPDWGYFKSPSTVTFSQGNAIAESSTVDFTVVAYTAIISGTVLNPDGSVPTGWNSISLSSKDGMYNWTQVDGNGNFSVKVAPTTYTIDIYSSNNQYASPDLAPVSVADGETKNLGTLNLVTKNEYITGKVVDTNGNALANQSVSTWKARGNGWAWTQTDANGNYSLRVSPGAWNVDAYPSYYGYGTGSNEVRYSRTQDPQQVTVNTNETISSINFTFAIADATIEGVVKDENGTTLSDVYGWLDIRSANTTTGSSMSWTGLGGEVSQGKFSVKVPAGTYNLGIWMSYQSNYTAITETPVTVAAGATVSDAVIVLIENDVTVTGTLKDASGTALTEVYGSIYATNGSSGSQWASISSGSYTLKLSRGTWRIGYWIDPRSGYLSRPLGNSNTLTLTKGETRTFDLTLQKLDSVISGKVLDPDGNPLPNAWVSIDTEFGGQKKSSSVYDYYGGMFNRGNITDANGDFTVNVPQGSYFVTVTVPTSFGFINPSVQEVTVTPDVPASLAFRFGRSDATITGSTTIGDDATSLRAFRALSSTKNPAYVSAYSQGGGFAEVYTNTGDYTLNVTKADTWHVTAVYETTTSFYRSDEFVLTVGDAGTAVQNLPMILSTTALPPAVSTTFPSNVTKVIQLDDGMTITIPAGSLSSTTVDVTVTATPKAQLPNQANAKLLMMGYDVQAKYASGQNNGQAISSFVQDVTISLPYTEAQLAEAGVTATELKPMYWDSTAGTWKTVENVVVDTENKRVSFTVQHFTNFALITTSSSAVAPTVTLTAPTENTVFHKNRLEVRGTVSDPDAQVTAQLNGGMARTLTVRADGSFTTIFGGMTVGENTVTVSAVNGTGTSATATRTVTYTRATRSDTADRIVITPAGRGGAQVIVADPDGTIRTNFFAYPSRYRMGITAIATDLNDDENEEIVTVPEPGHGTQIRIFSITGTPLGAFFPYGERYSGGVNMVIADVNGDGDKEIVTVPRAAGMTAVRIFNGNGRLLGAFPGWAKGFKGNLRLATADLDGDLQAEILVTAEKDGSPAVRIFDADGRLLGAFFLFPRQLRGGFQVIAADTDADGDDEIVAAPVNKHGPQVRVFNGDGRVLTSFFALPRTFRDGIKLSSGDLTGDGRDEIVVTAAANGGPVVRAFDWQGQVVTNFFAYRKSFRGGFSTVTSDLDDDGYAEIITAPGAGFGPQVRVFDRKAQPTATFMALHQKFRGGVNISVND